MTILYIDAQYSSRICRPIGHHLRSIYKDSVPEVGFEGSPKYNSFSDLALLLIVAELT
jgi:hypothetical protein